MAENLAKSPVQTAPLSASMSSPSSGSPLLARKNSFSTANVRVGFEELGKGEHGSGGLSRRDSHFQRFQQLILSTKVTVDEEKEEQQSALNKICCSLHFKTFLILCILFLLLLACEVGILAGVLPKSFADLEEQTTKDSGKRVARASYDDLNTFALKVFDFAAWQPAYDAFEGWDNVTFDRSKLDQHIYENYYCDYMVGTINVHFAMFYFPDGRLAAEVSCLDRENITTVPQEFAGPLDLTHPIMQGMTDVKTRFAGYMVVGGQLMMVGAIPIQPYWFEPPVRGVLLWARHVTDLSIKDMAVRAQLCLSFHRVETWKTDAAVAGVQDLATKTTPIQPTLATPDWEHSDGFAVQPLDTSNKAMLVGRECWQDASSDRIAVFQVINDVFKKPLMIVRADSPRYIFNLGLKSFFLAVGLVVGVSLVTSVGISIFIERSVIHRISLLSTSVKKVRYSDADVWSKIPKFTLDEVGNLARHVRNMLRNLSGYQQRLKEDQEKLKELLHRTSLEEHRSRSIMNAIHDFIITVDCSTGVLLHANNAFYTQLQYTIQETEGKIAITRVFPEQELKQILEQFAQLSVGGGGNIDTTICTILGKKIPVKVSASRLKMFLENKEVEAYVVLARNMTEQHQLMKNLEQEKQRMEALKKNIDFENVMKTSYVREKFKQFCKKEMSEENFLFLEAVTEYKGIRKTHERANKQTEIQQTFLNPNAKKALNVSHKVIESEMFMIEKGYGQVDLFDSLESTIKQMVIKDTFARFTKQNDLAKLFQQAQKYSESDELSSGGDITPRSSMDISSM